MIEPADYAATKAENAELRAALRHVADELGTLATRKPDDDWIDLGPSGKPGEPVACTIRCAHTRLRAYGNGETATCDDCGVSYVCVGCHGNGEQCRWCKGTEWCDDSGEWGWQCDECIAMLAD